MLSEPEIYIFTSDQEKWRYNEICKWIDDVCRNSFYLHKKAGCDIRIKHINIDTEKNDVMLNIEHFAFNSEKNDMKICVYIDLAEKVYAFLKNKYKTEILEKNKLKNKDRKKMFFLCSDRTVNDHVKALRTASMYAGIMTCSSFYASRDESLELCIKHAMKEINNDLISKWEREFITDTEYKYAEPNYYDI